MNKHPKAVIPKALFKDQEAEQRWRARFTAPWISLPRCARDAPERCLYLSNQSGAWEIFAWDRSTNMHRQVTNRSNGTLSAAISPDGSSILWFNDTDGNEFGNWVVESFNGQAKGEKAQPAFTGIPDGYKAGLTVGKQVAAVGISTDNGSTIWLTRNGARAEAVYTSSHVAGVVALSRDERFLAIRHSEYGDSRHPALKVLGVADTNVVAEKWDGKGKGLHAIAFSPVSGDSRLLVAHERNGKRELTLWDVLIDQETEIELDLPGEVAASWYQDGNALLVTHTYQARTSLYRYDMQSETLSSLQVPPGMVSACCTRPGGTVEYNWSSSAVPSAIHALSPNNTNTVLLEPPGRKAPSSAALTDVFIPGSGGSIHALVAKPANVKSDPLPTIFALHGGPHNLDRDEFSAYRAVWIDAGFAVVHVNYRGSSGYGSVWRDAIEGKPGLTELADIATAQNWAINSGLADPQQCVISGPSWGGYLVLLALGVQPERWAAGVARVPVADYVAAYEDETKILQALDQSLFGGTPTEVPDVYRERSPITYVNHVKAPVLVIAGENDPRCPIRQIENYLDRLAANNATYEVYRYNAGHGSLVVEETINQTAIEVDFTRRMLGMTS